LDPRTAIEGDDTIPVLDDRIARRRRELDAP
jgi:hypothetical protein